MYTQTNPNIHINKNKHHIPVTRREKYVCSKKKKGKNIKFLLLNSFEVDLYNFKSTINTGKHIFCSHYFSLFYLDIYSN